MSSGPFLSTARRSRRRIRPSRVVIGVAALAAVVAAAFGVIAFLERDSIPHGTTVGGVDVGGMDEAQARAALQREASARLARPVRLAGPGGSLVTSGEGAPLGAARRRGPRGCARGELGRSRARADRDSRRARHSARVPPSSGACRPAREPDRPQVRRPAAGRRRGRLGRRDPCRRGTQGHSGRPPCAPPGAAQPSAPGSRCPSPPRRPSCRPPRQKPQPPGSSGFSTGPGASVSRTRPRRSPRPGCGLSSGRHGRTGRSASSSIQRASLPHSA